jgi:redox-sensitive bicupin YhaK (pirin superfamily)
MEIISYVIDGELTHGDSMGNKRTLSRGDVQYMSAGTGVVHSEHNFGSEMLRFLQIWILPDQKNYAPDYGDVRFKFEDRVDRWLPIAAWTENTESDAPIKIHQDMNIYATMIRAGKSLPFEIREDRQAYMILIEGSADVNGTELNMRDAVEITGESIDVHAKEYAHLLILEMAQSK